jgi:hypothetical protein
VTTTLDPFAAIAEECRQLCEVIRGVERPVCRHCRKHLAYKPRGLCWACYRTPGIRELYPPTSKFAQHGHPDFYGRGTVPAPTTALPGSPEKIAVLEERARLGQQLWHPLDARLDRRKLAALADA